MASRAQRAERRPSLRPRSKQTGGADPRRPRFPFTSLKLADHTSHNQRVVEHHSQIDRREGTIRHASKLPSIAARPLRERHKPFDGPDWIFEIKYDGYRGLLYLEGLRARLISRNRREMKRFSALARALVPLIDAKTAILDGEIVCKDATGRPVFLDLMRRRDDASYVAFDLLWLNGEEARRLSRGCVFWVKTTLWSAAREPARAGCCLGAASGSRGVDNWSRIENFGHRSWCATWHHDVPSSRTVHRGTGA